MLCRAEAKARHRKAQVKELKAALRAKGTQLAHMTSQQQHLIAKLQAAVTDLTFWKQQVTPLSYSWT